jgi:hypothetical protein
VEIVNVIYSGQGKTLQNYTPRDENLVSSNYINASFGDTNDRVELFVYDVNGNLLTSEYDYRGYTPYQIIDPATGKFDKILIDPAEDAKALGFDRGSFNVQYEFHKNLFNSSDLRRFWIKEISPSRTELKLSSQTISGDDIINGFNQYQAYISLKNYYPDFYLNLSNNDQLIAINATTVTDDSGTYLIIKLYEPLPFDYDVKTQLWIYDEISESVSYDVEIQIQAEVSSTENSLRGPNFNIRIGEKNTQTTPYYSYTSLLASPVTSSFRQLASYYQDKAISINLDYTDFSNFVHFSSATERVNNFTYKMNLIENYNNQITSQSAIIGNATVKSNTITTLQSSVSNIIENFDIYEYYLYYSSESFAWPKTNSVKPYQNASVTSSAVLNWLGSENTLPTVGAVSMLYSASYYDDTNKDILRGTIPQYIQEDSNNQPYVTFIDMMGQHFDNIWVYYKDVTNRFNATNDPSTGISIDMVSDALRGMGMELYTNTNVSDNVYYDLFGYNYDGSLLPPTGSEKINTYVTSSLTTQGSKDLQQEIYKRIYHNLPYLLKSRGTQRSIKALISIYGIPDSILTVNEFGGYDRNLVDGVDSINNNKVTAFTSSLQISSSLLSPYSTLQYYDNDSRRNSTNIEVGFSIADILDRNITSSLGYFDIDQLIGNPNDQYSSSYTPLVSASNAYFSTYTQPHSVWEYIRLIKYFNNSLFKTIKDFVPARANLSTGIIVKSHMLERNKYARHEPTATFEEASQSIDMLTLSAEPGNMYSGSNTNWNYIQPTILGNVAISSSQNVEKLTGEFGGTEIIVTTGNALSQAENSNNASVGLVSVTPSATFQNVNQSVRSKRFFDLDYNFNQLVPTNFGIITQSISNSIDNNYNTYTNPNSPYAYVQDYNYATRHFTDPRYYGSNNSSAKYNVYTNGDTSYGKTAAIDKLKYQYAYLVDIYSSSIYLPKRSNAQIKYLIDNNQNILDLTKANNNIFEIQNVYKSGESSNISLFKYDEKNPYSQLLANNSDLQIYEGGFRYLPMLHNISGSNSPKQGFNLDNPITITIPGSSGGGGSPIDPNDEHLKAINYSVHYWSQEIEVNPGVTSDFTIYASASYIGPGGAATFDVNLSVSSYLNLAFGSCNTLTPASTINITIFSGTTTNDGYLGDLVSLPSKGFGNGFSIAGGNHWPATSLPTSCTLIVSAISAGSSGGGGDTPSFTYYTSYVTASQNCLYYISQSNQFVLDSSITSYITNNYNPIFDSTTDLAWLPGNLERVVIPLSLEVGDKISLTTGSLGWDEKYEYTIKSLSIVTGSTETTQSYLIEVSDQVNLTLMTSSIDSPDPITGAPLKACRYIIWKHVPDETNVMLRYDPKDSTIVEEGLLFPQYIDKTVKENAGNIIKALRAQNLLPPSP